MKELKNYIAFRRIKNFACIQLYPQAKCIVIYLKLDPNKVVLEPGFTRDVTNIGHNGTGDLEVTLKTTDDLSKAQTLLAQAYDDG